MALHGLSEGFGVGDQVADGYGEVLEGARIRVIADGGVSCFPTKADCRRGPWRAGVRRLYADDGHRLMGSLLRSVRHSKGGYRDFGFGSLRGGAEKLPGREWLAAISDWISGRWKSPVRTSPSDRADVGTRQDPFIT